MSLDIYGEFIGPDVEQLAQEMGFKQEEIYETISNLARYAESDQQD